MSFALPRKMARPFCCFMANRLLISKLFFFALVVMIFSACSSELKKVEDIQEYHGPIMEVDEAETLYSDSAVVRVKSMAKKQLEFENGDREFPEGLYIEFYDVLGEISSTLKSNAGNYYRADNVYRVYGDVVLKSKSRDEQLNTEELYWNPETEKVNTDKFVTIYSEGDVLQGEGIEATQDFDYYKILHPVGTIGEDE